MKNFLIFLMIAKEIPQKQPRSCAGCTACCIALRIDFKPGYSTRLDNGEDISKKPGTKCRFLGEHGCTIYEVRPIVCRQFKCDWLLKRNGFNHNDSPKNTGKMSVRGKIFNLKNQ